MSNIAKWLPKQNNDMNKIFTETRNIERELRILGKMFATNINYTQNTEHVSRCAWIKVNINKISISWSVHSNVKWKFPSPLCSFSKENLKLINVNTNISIWLMILYESNRDFFFNSLFWINDECCYPGFEWAGF